MKKFWIILIAFTCAYIAQGDCSWLGRSSRDTSSVLPRQSEANAGYVIGQDPTISEMHAPPAQERVAERILRNTKNGFISRSFASDSDEDHEGSSISSAGQETPAMVSEKTANEFVGGEGGNDEGLHLVSEGPDEVSSGDEYKVEAQTTEDITDAPKSEDDEDEARQERGAPEHRYEMNINEPFAMPPSDIRWSGLAMAHGRRRDDPVRTKKAKQKADDSDASSGQTIMLVIFISSGLLIVLFMTAFFIFAWPIRKYYASLCQLMNQDVESGWYMHGDELSGIQVDPSYASEYRAVPSPPPPPPKRRDTPVWYRNSVDTKACYTQPPSSYRKPTKSKKNARSASSKNRKPREQIVAEDRKRDARNAERRKIIRRETKARRDSLVHNLLLAKAVIDGHAKNKNFEKKAKERRCVIKTCCSGQGANPSKRRLSFLEELTIAKDVVAPRWDYKQSVEKSMEKCRTIKEQCGGKRRLSLKEQLGVARDVIVDSERRERSLPAEVVQEMIRARRAPGGPVRYYNDLIDQLFKEREHFLENNYGNNREFEELESSEDIDEITSGISGLLIIDDEPASLSTEERQGMIENEVREGALRKR